MKIKRLLIVGLVICVFIGVAFFAVKRKKAALSLAKPLGSNPIPVSVVSVKEGDFISTKRYVGIVEPLNAADISSRITADIVKVLCREGKSVKKGDMLIKLDDRNLVQAITVLNAKLEGIKTQIVSNNVNIKSLTASANYWLKQLKRDKQLYDKNIVSAKQLELSTERLNESQGKLDVTSQKNKTLEAQLTAIQGDIRIAETNLSYADIKAPFDGIVCDVPVDPGDQASPGKKLMTFENQHQLKVVVQFPQIDMQYVHLGDTLSLQCGDTMKSAKISKIYPALGANRMMKVEAILPIGHNNGFISGQYIKAALATNVIKNVLIVPSAAINIDNNKNQPNSLFLLKNGRLKKVDVKLLGNNQIEAAVSGALKVGDKAVVSAYLGWAELADGLKAELVKP